LRELFAAVIRLSIVECVEGEPKSEGGKGHTTDGDPKEKAPGVEFMQGGDSSVVPVDLSLLYRRQRPAMVRLAQLLTGSFEIAEEVVQEAFVKLQLAPAVAQTPEYYLRAIVANLARDHLRRLRLERALRPEARIVVSAPEVDETWGAVCLLPFRQRAVLALRYYEDLAEAEIAQILGCRIGTVKSTHHRALATLRRKLS
jgi:RNA polymerase sigma factor (sigma-70 family)